MKFQLIDAVVEQTSDRIVAIKQVSLAEEYLADHFPSFPVLPGVMMIEAMVQAARMMLPKDQRLVLGEVKALKFGNMVRPGQSLLVEVTLSKPNDDGSFTCKGSGAVLSPTSPTQAELETAVSGRFTMRPVRV
jgi:3-hydroxyacyl-[acyl-carrier-protein] dehydratase